MAKLKDLSESVRDMFVDLKNWLSTVQSESIEVWEVKSKLEP